MAPWVFSLISFVVEKCYNFAEHFSFCTLLRATLLSVLAFENSPSTKVAKPCHGAHYRNQDGSEVGIHCIFLNGDEVFYRNP